MVHTQPSLYWAGAPLAESPTSTPLGGNHRWTHFIAREAEAQRSSEFKGCNVTIRCTESHITGLRGRKALVPFPGKPGVGATELDQGCMASNPQGLGGVLSL